MSLNNSCIIVAAGDNFDEITNKDNSLVIAADGGLKYCKNIKVDYAIGDFDSLGYVPNDIKNVIALNPMKDNTDTLAAIDLAISLGKDTFYIYGAFGGERQAHSLANIAALNYISKKGLKAVAFGKNENYVVIRKEIIFEKESSGFISIFSLNEKSIGVTEENLKYKLNDYELHNDSSLGVSNEFIGEESKITLKDGVLLVVFSKNAKLKKFE